MPKLNPAAPIKPMQGIQDPNQIASQLYRMFGMKPAGTPSVSTYPTAAVKPMKAPQPSKQQAPAQDGLVHRNTPGWRMGVSIAPQFASSPSQQVHMNARSLVTTPKMASHPLTRMMDLLDRLATVPVPMSLGIILG